MDIKCPVECPVKCPECHSIKVVKNGTQPAWKKIAGVRIKRRVQLFKCNTCGRQFRKLRKGQRKAGRHSAS